MQRRAESGFPGEVLAWAACILSSRRIRAFPKPQRLQLATRLCQHANQICVTSHNTCRGVHRVWHERRGRHRTRSTAHRSRQATWHQPILRALCPQQHARRHAAHLHAHMCLVMYSMQRIYCVPVVTCSHRHLVPT